MKYIVFLAALVTLFSSCKKFLDHFYSHHPGKPSSNPPCRIDSIYPREIELYSVAAGVQYNGKGYPISVNYTFNDEYPTQFTSVYTYDQKGRLLEQNPDFIYYTPKQTRYVYEGDSKLPVRDTIFELYVTVVEDLHYDAHGRINKVVRHFTSIFEDDTTNMPDQTFKYYYDARGNRQEDPLNENYPGIIEYTDKPSLYSLHPVWQLVHKNFSRNSTALAETYNAEGLPLRLKDDPDQNIQPFLQMGPAPGYEFSYTCRAY